MIEVMVLLDSIEKVRNFVKSLSKFRSRIDMRSAGGAVDARSILGLFSFDLSEPITLLIEEGAETKEILAAISQYRTDSPTSAMPS